MEWGQVGASGVSMGHRSRGGVQRKGRPFQRLWRWMGLMLRPTPCSCPRPVGPELLSVSSLALKLRVLPSHAGHPLRSRAMQERPC